eukprot:77178-Chlamydomonas_euryale.AAC.3
MTVAAAEGTRAVPPPRRRASTDALHAAAVAAAVAARAASICAASAWLGGRGTAGIPRSPPTSPPHCDLAVRHAATRSGCSRRCSACRPRRSVLPVCLSAVSRLKPFARASLPSRSRLTPFTPEPAPVEGEMPRTAASARQPPPPRWTLTLPRRGAASGCAAPARVSAAPVPRRARHGAGGAALCSEGCSVTAERGRASWIHRWYLREGARTARAPSGNSGQPCRARPSCIDRPLINPPMGDRHTHRTQPKRSNQAVVDLGLDCQSCATVMRPELSQEWIDQQLPKP